MLATCLWVDAWLRGRVATDDLLAALARLCPDAPVPDAGTLSQLRAGREQHVWLVLPRPGRTVGWPQGLACPEQPALLLDAGDDVRMLREERGWRVEGPLAGGPAAAGALAAMAVPARRGARAFADLLDTASAELEALALAGPARDEPIRSWTDPLAHLPTGVDPQAGHLVQRIAAMLDVLELAAREEGSSVTAAESRARRGPLVRVHHDLLDLVVGVVGGLHPAVQRDAPTGPPLPVAWPG